MRWPIRNQILIPFLIIQVISFSVISITFAVRSVRDVEREISTRLDRVRKTVGDSRFPLTAAVLKQIQMLSGAEFVLVTETQGVWRSTFETNDVSIRELKDEASIERHSLAEVNGERFFSTRVKLQPAAGEGVAVILYPERIWNRARRNAIYPPLAIGGLTLLVTIAASVWLARRFGHRIRRVQDQVAKIAGGEFQKIEPQRLNDEVGDLSRDVNRMCEALEEAGERIRENERANLISQVAGGLSHQLRNSLTGARMAVQLHARGCAVEDEAIDIALKQLELTEQHIKGLLRLTRGEQRTAAPAAVTEVLSETASLVEPICKHFEIAFSVGIADDARRIRDGDAIRGAVLNLLMNAIDAAGPNGQVGIISRAESDRAVIEITDSGPGIPEEIAERIFDPFFSTKPEGVGLGLALVQKTAIDHRGQLTVRRDADRTVFRFEFQPDETP